MSNAHNVTLLSVGRDISGLFQCEVSADAPLFHTQMMSAPMTVAGKGIDFAVSKRVTVPFPV